MKRTGAAAAKARLGKYRISKVNYIILYPLKRAEKLFGNKTWKTPQAAGLRMKSRMRTRVGAYGGAHCLIPGRRLYLRHENGTPYPTANEHNGLRTR